ncbi:MAG: long-chain fatty acid--CoA ligase [Alphaproteobacteria bacterium GM7ARS4]|nr:long-chain fatty acid--CoA ligase [Alphaproteobacteria bacterium GM7ARS4]
MTRQERQRQEWPGWRSLPDMFFSQAQRYGDRPFLSWTEEGVLKQWGWRQVAWRAHQLGDYLSRLGVKKGERVILCMPNSPHWLISDMAIMSRGAITVPLYTTYGADDYRYLLEHTAPHTVIIDVSLWDVFVQASVVETTRHVLLCGNRKDCSAHNAPSLHFYDDIVAAYGTHETTKDTWRDAWDVEGVTEDDTASMIYTSGSTQRPKGVVLSHKAFLSNCRGCYMLLADILGERELYLSFLPLSHAYERTAGQFLLMALGGRIHYVESLEHLVTSMAQYQPTVMAVVPRLLHVIRSRILAQARALSGMKALLWRYSLTWGTERLLQGAGGWHWWKRFLDRLLSLLIRRRIRHLFGKRLKLLVSGGAALPEELAIFFNALDVPLVQGYGQTESAPVISCNLPASHKIGSVGLVLPNAHVHISAQGEILVRGDLVMDGYWRDKEATRSALQTSSSPSEGVSDEVWLHTGDKGHLDKDGYLWITGRIKDIIVTSGGDTLSPQRIEGLLSLETPIMHCAVFGNDRPWLCAVIVPEPSWAQGKSTHAIRQGINDVLSKVHKALPTCEHVRRYVIAHEPFSVDNGLLTPTMKVRRQKVEEHYQGMLKDLYGR